MPHFLRMLALILALLASPALAQDMPVQPDGPILDEVDLLPAAEEAALDQKLRDYTAQTGRSIVIAIVSTLNGEPVDVYARNLGEQWGVGGAETEEAIVLLIAPNEREMWISTARGVQGRLTDITAGRIYRETLRPAFRAGDFVGGINSAVDQMIERLNMEPAQAQAMAEAEAAAERQRQSDGGFPFGGFIWLGFLCFFFVLPMLRRGRRYRAKKGKGPWGRRNRDIGDTVGDIILWEVGSAIVRGAMSGGDDWGGRGGFGGGGGFGGFGGGGGGFNGGGAGGGW